MQEAAPHRPWVGRCLQDPAGDQGMVWVGRDPRRSWHSPEQGAQNHSTAEAGGGPLRISQARAPRARHAGRHPGGVWLSPEQEPPAQPLWAACPSPLSPSHASVCARCLPSCHRAQPAEPGSILLHPPIHTEEIEALGSPSPRIMESLRLEKVPNRTCSNPRAVSPSTRPSPSSSTPSAGDPSSSPGCVPAVPAMCPRSQPGPPRGRSLCCGQSPAPAPHSPQGAGGGPLSLLQPQCPRLPQPPLAGLVSQPLPQPQPGSGCAPGPSCPCSEGPKIELGMGCRGLSRGLEPGAGAGCRQDPTGPPGTCRGWWGHGAVAELYSNERPRDWGWELHTWAQGMARVCGVPMVSPSCPCGVPIVSPWCPCSVSHCPPLRVPCQPTQHPLGPSPWHPAPWARQSCTCTGPGGQRGLEGVQEAACEQVYTCATCVCAWPACAVCMRAWDCA